MPESQKPLKWYRSLTTSKGRLAAGAFIVEGERAIRQILASQPSQILEILSVDELPTALASYPSRRITESQLLYISSTQAPQGILAVVKKPADIYSATLPAEPGNKILLLENIQDPGNVGTLIRTAAAFGFSCAIMSDKCSDPLSPKCVQASAGSVLSLRIRRTTAYLEMASSLKKAGYTIAATDLNGKADLSILSRQDKLVLALGNEGAGLSDVLLSIADYRIKVPIAIQKAESLNVAVCGAICMYLSAQKSG